MMEDKARRSPAMEEIYRSSPDPLVRGANLVFALVLIMLITISSLVKFTITVNAKVVLHGNEFQVENTSGRLSPAQPAVITIASYPPEQYGFLKGTLRKGRNDSLILLLDDPGSKNIPLSEGLQGNAEVVVGEESLLRRLATFFKL